MTLARMTRINKVPDTTALPGLREMQVKDIPKVSQLFSLYIKRFGMAPVFSETEVKHQLLSGSGQGEVGSGGPGRREGQVTWSYVVEVRTLLPVLLYDRPGSQYGLSDCLRIRNRRISQTSFHSTRCLQL